MKTPAERKQAERNRKRTSGLVRKEIWCRPEDWPAIKQHAETLAKKNKE